MCLSGECGECSVRRQRVELARAADDNPRGFGAIFSRDGRVANNIHYTLDDALRLINTGKVKEGDILFPALIEIILMDGEVG